MSHREKRGGFFGARGHKPQAKKVVTRRFGVRSPPPRGAECTAGIAAMAPAAVAAARASRAGIPIGSIAAVPSGVGRRTSALRRAARSPAPIVVPPSSRPSRLAAPAAPVRARSPVSGRLPVAVLVLVVLAVAVPVVPAVGLTPAPVTRCAPGGSSNLEQRLDKLLKELEELNARFPPSLGFAKMFPRPGRLLAAGPILLPRSPLRSPSAMLFERFVMLPTPRSHRRLRIYAD